VQPVHKGNSVTLENYTLISSKVATPYVDFPRENLTHGYKGIWSGMCIYFFKVLQIRAKSKNILNSL
jgi:hypothetical protein